MSDPQVMRFLKAASQRLVAADVLLRHSKHVDGTYLAGYVVECSLKALVLSYIRASERSEFIRQHFRGQVAHDFQYLVFLLLLRGVNIPKPVRRALVQAKEIWSTDLRYHGGQGKAADAQFLRNAGEMILSWVQRSVT